MNVTIRGGGIAATVLALALASAACDTRKAETEVAENAQEEPHQSSDGMARVRLDAEQVGSLGVEVRALGAGGATAVLERPATLQLDPDRIALVGPRIEGKVERILRDLGDAVRPGDALAVMSSVELGEAKAQHLALKARLETARAAYQREQRLLDDQISSEAEVLEAEAQYRQAQADIDVVHERLRLYGLTDEAIENIEPDAAEPLSFFRLTSPIEGVIQRRDVSPGQTVGPTETPIHVARLDRLWVMIDAFEQDVPRLAVGQPVSLSLRSLPGRTFDAVIDWISFELEPETRTVRVRAVVRNPKGSLRAGMFGTAAIHVRGEASVASIPADAVQSVEGEDVVFVPGSAAGEFRAVPVTLGAEAGGNVEITDGLAPGDSAVVSGAFELMSAATAPGRSAEHEE